METLEKIASGTGPIGVMLAAAVALLWREREKALDRERGQLVEQLKAAEAENANLRGALAESQRAHLKDAERFLVALERKRAPSSPPSQT
jgi:hypothetical protein